MNAHQRRVAKRRTKPSSFHKDGFQLIRPELPVRMDVLYGTGQYRTKLSAAKFSKEPIVLESKEEVSMRFLRTYDIQPTISERLDVYGPF